MFKSCTSLAIVLLSNIGCAAVIYVTGHDENVYSLPIDGGSFSQVNTAPIPSGITTGIEVSGAEAYVTAGGNLYAVPLTRGPFSQINLNPSPTGTAGISSSGNTAYITDGGNNVYSIPLSGGDFVQINAVPIPTGITNSIDIAGSNAYISDFLGNVYSLPLAGGSFTLLNTSPVPGPGPGNARGIYVNGDSIYVVNGTGGQVYSIPIAGGTPTLVNSTPSPGSFIRSIAILNNIVYLDDTNNGDIFAMALNNPNFFPQVNVGSAPNPPWDIDIFNPPAPYWNTVPTAVAQLAQNSLSQLLTDHLRFVKPRKKVVEMKKEFLSPQTTNFGNNQEPRIKKGKTKQIELDEESSDSEKTPVYPWVEIYGKYAQEKPHHQTPGFYVGSGGILAALDYDGWKRGPIGIGFAYSYSLIRGQHSKGNANVKQGYGTIYGTYNAAHTYLDMGFWGGYYYAHNHREIHAYGFDGIAKSLIHGWQFSPHLELGYDYERNWFTLEPFIMADWVGTWEHHFREHHAIAFETKQKGRFCSFLRTETGLRFFQTFNKPQLQIVLLEKASYAYQKFFHTGNIEAEIINIPQSFVLESFGTAQNLGIVEVKILFLPTKLDCYATLDYQGEFGASYQSHLGTVSVGRDF